jgi:hypothetical protein
MGKRIRHLEFYGYADQNTYMGLPNTDLSDIRKVNREQDKEINSISGATKEKADAKTVNELSGKVESFIDKQDMINKHLAKGINKNRERIEKLEARDEEITNKINEIADDFDPIYENISSLSGKVDTLDTKLTNHINQESTFETEITRRVNNVENALGSKLDRCEADTIYAKKNDVYTKAEVDNKIAGITTNFATEQWVLDRGYITTLDADSRYASKSNLNSLNERVTSVEANLYHQYNELNSDFLRFKNDASTKINTLNGRVNTLESRYDREIGNLQTKDEYLQSQINQNKEEIRRINEISLPNKVNKSDFDDLKDNVDALSDSLDKKVDKTDFVSYQSQMAVRLESIEANKASKRDVEDATAYTNSVESKLDQEIQDRINGDIALGLRIDETNGSIAVIREENVTRDERLRNLERDLAKEVNDRVEGDNAIIGNPTDREGDNTIYGAKKYADYVSTQALISAKGYTDTKDSRVRDYIDETKADLERQISGKATKAYVDEAKNEIINTIEPKILEEKSRAQSAEAGLESAIRRETARAIDKERTISTALTHTSNIVKALTDWDGDDRIDYTDAGNGIVDVMHREIHDIKETISALTQVGLGIRTTNEHEVGFGTYNDSHTGLFDSDKTMFTIGIGTSDIDRKNGIEVRKDGSVYMWIEGEYMKINNLLAMLAHETY